MTYKLIIFRCDQDRLDRLDDHIRAYRVESVADVESTREALEHGVPDALIAPINTETLALFRSIVESAELPERPLLVLVSETPRGDLPADLVLPVRWLDQALLSELKLRGELLQIRQKLEAEIREAQAHISEQKRAAEEIDLLKNAIVRTVSHELKTPLLHVKSAVAMLSDSDAQDRSTLVGYATEATARLEAVVKNITQLADSLEIHLEPAQASDALAQASRNLRRRWQHKNEVERVRIVIPKRMPLVWADKQALGIVLQQLIDNALKFSHKEVEVTAEVNETHVLIAVKDYGIGIAPIYLDKIFDPFYQIDSSDARRFGGIGVGLAIVRLILERHQAAIYVESEPGVGSTFHFALRRIE